MKKVNSIYIHFPFCLSKCFYCSFYSEIYEKELVDKYLESLKKEFDYFNKNFDLSRIETVYIGGGTPGIDVIALEKINEILTSNISLNSIKEYTIECNPLNIKNELNDFILKNIPKPRISLGIQSFDNNVLKKCNRKQTLKIVLKALKRLNRLKFKNISIDLILGLPETKIGYESKLLDKILKKNNNINHVSMYHLTIEKGSVFFKNKNELKLMNENELLKFEKILQNVLKLNKFRRYEVSNYCKKNCSCLHNLNYWKYKNYIGLGPSACSTVDEIRIENLPNIKLYIKNNFEEYKKTTILNKKEQIEEFILMGLRLIQGIKLDDFKEKFNISIEQLFTNTIEKYKSKKMISFKNNRLKVNQKGMKILNKILVDFFYELELKSM